MSSLVDFEFVGSFRCFGSQPPRIGFSSSGTSRATWSTVSVSNNSSYALESSVDLSDSSVVNTGVSIVRRRMNLLLVLVLLLNGAMVLILLIIILWIAEMADEVNVVVVGGCWVVEPCWSLGLQDSSLSLFCRHTLTTGVCPEMEPNQNEIEGFSLLGPLSLSVVESVSQRKRERDRHSLSLQVSFIHSLSRTHSAILGDQQPFVTLTHDDA